MMKLRFLWLVFGVGIIIGGCDKEEQVTDLTQFPRVKIEDQSIFENEAAEIEVVLTWAYEQDVKVDYEITSQDNGLADPDDDFIEEKGTITIPKGSTTGAITATIIDDVITESDEKFKVVLSNAVYGKLINSEATITILNDDDELVIDGAGFVAPELYQGYLRVWEEDFSSSQINTDVWTHEIGGEGWGNEELQYYTDRLSNSFQSGGYLLIEAKEETFGNNQYTSARLVSQSKYEVQYGRVDIRARMPKGKGLWPALWMLGHDFKDVGWPHCGEIDIMELIGSQPKIIHGTAHYQSTNDGAQSNGNSTFLSGGGDYSDEFHVFSIIWRENYIEWQVDGKKYHSLTPADIDGVWPYNDEFFFILNVAVGGQWPGSPDATTVFPQQMLVDYIRLYQLV